MKRRKLDAYREIVIATPGLTADQHADLFERWLAAADAYAAEHERAVAVISSGANPAVTVSATFVPDDAVQPVWLDNDLSPSATVTTFPAPEAPDAPADTPEPEPEPEEQAAEPEPEPATPPGMVQVVAAGGRLVFWLPEQDADLAIRMSHHFDATLFWVGAGVNNGWLPCLLPRHLWKRLAAES